MFLLLALLAACDTQIECGKLLCDANQYCYQDLTDTADPFQEPVCADPPASCGVQPSCDCIEGCDACTEEDGRVFCRVGE